MGGTSSAASSSRTCPSPTPWTGRKVPCSCVPRLGGQAVASVDDRGGPGVGAPGLALLIVGQGQHPEGQDLVDLGGVIEVTGALGGHFRMVVEDDRGGQDQVVPHQHRVDALAPTRGGRRRRGVGGIEEGDEGGVVRGHHDVQSQQGVAQRPVPATARTVRGGGVLDGDSHPYQVRPAVGRHGTHPDLTGHPVTATHQPARSRPLPRHNRLGLRAGVELERMTRALGHHGRQRQRSEVEGAVDGLIPGHMGGPVHLEAFRRNEPGALGPGVTARRLDGSLLLLQEADPDRHGGGRSGADQALGAGRRSLGGVVGAPCRGHEHAELPADLVLGRGGAVGIEHVPLVEDGVGHRLGRAEPIADGNGHGTVSATAAKRCSMARSQVGRPREARNRWSSSNVRRSIRSQALFGK